MPGMKGMRLKDMPVYSLPTNPDDFMLNFMIEQTQNCTKSSAVIINTFYEFETEVLDALASSFPRIYTIGPLITQSLPNPKLNLSVWKEDTECIPWLDGRDLKSVVYVNFGSVAVMNEQQINTIADGLERCGFYFLWVLRPDILKDGDQANLLEGFLERTKDRGLIVSWSPQEMVLKHPSVGLFITHGGWNSMLESVVAGIAVLCWVYGAEQPTNSRQVCLVWRNGIEIDKNMNGSEIAELVREMMTGDDEGKVKRGKALEWKKVAEEATINGGSSHVSFEKLIKEILQKECIASVC
jgi:UDP:flavonoid glycosyltransferase YjiC (YdhE family)